jgi:hypothetical protein
VRKEKTKHKVKERMGKIIEQEQRGCDKFYASAPVFSRKSVKKFVNDTLSENDVFVHLEKSVNKIDGECYSVTTNSVKVVSANRERN